MDRQEGRIGALLRGALDASARSGDQEARRRRQLARVSREFDECARAHSSRRTPDATQRGGTDGRMD
jgi:hypothetical protein